MDIETVEWLLEKYHTINEDITGCEKRITELEEQFYLSAAPQQDDMPKTKTNHISNPTANLALNIPDFVSKEIKRCHYEILLLQQVKMEIHRILFRLPHKEYKVIDARLFKQYSWIKLGMYLGYSERQCQRMYNSALQELQQGFSNNQTILRYLSSS